MAANIDRLIEETKSLSPIDRSTFIDRLMCDPVVLRDYEQNFRAELDRRSEEARLHPERGITLDEWEMKTRREFGFRK